MRPMLRNWPNSGCRQHARYAQIAPAVPHALPMPSHIYARLGLWHEDIQSNLSSLAAARKHSAVHIGAENQIHAMEFLEYAYLQIGDDDNAKAMVVCFRRILRDNVTENLRSNYFDGRIAYPPALYALEMHCWKEAVALPPPAEVEAHSQAITCWARAVGAGHLRDLAAARYAVSQYDAMLEATKKGTHAVRAKYMGTEQDEAHAWLAFLEGKTRTRSAYCAESQISTMSKAKAKWPCLRAKCWVTCYWRWAGQRQRSPRTRSR